MNTMFDKLAVVIWPTLKLKETRNQMSDMLQLVVPRPTLNLRDTRNQMSDTLYPMTPLGVECL
jgi:hypothetical protein